MSDSSDTLYTIQILTVFECRRTCKAVSAAKVANTSALLAAVKTFQSWECLLSRTIVSRSWLTRPRTTEIAVMTKPSSEPQIVATAPYTGPRLPCKIGSTVAAPPRK